jgi:hypothetical protein
MGVYRSLGVVKTASG